MNINKAYINAKKLFPIVPLEKYSKIPFKKWGSKENWLNNVDELENYCEKNDKVTGFSLLTGFKSDVMVLDIDKNHGENSANGLENINKFIEEFSAEEKESVFNTFTVQTPRGGLHLYFKYKKGLKNKANYIDGVDIRTDGGIIVLPESRVITDDGIKQYHIVKDNEINDMPPVLFNKLMKIFDNKEMDKDNIEEINIKSYKEGCRNDQLFKDVIEIVSKSTIRDINKIASIAKGLNLIKCKPPLDDKEVLGIVNSINQRLHPPFCNSKGNIIESLLVDYILEKNPSYKKGNLWFIYDNKKGCYYYKEYEDVQRMFFEYAVNDTDKTALNARKFADLLMLKSENANKSEDEKRYINCLNGIIDIENNKLIKHDPKYKLGIQFNAKLITEEDEWKEKFNKSKFKKCIYELLDKHSIKTLQESWGLMLSPQAKRVQNCFIYKGEGSNGKSLLFDIQEALIGDNEHICSIGLGDFGGEFVISSAEGKHVNIVRDDELSGKTIHRFFKSMCCAEPVPVNRKNKNIIRIPFNLTMFFGLNRMPNTSDRSAGFFRRPIIIPFNVSFGTKEEVEKGLRDKIKDTELADKIIKDELDIIFTWAYKGLQRLKENNWQVTVSQLSKKEMDEYRQEVDTVYAFYKEKIDVCKNIRSVKAEIYEEYVIWCEANGMKALNNVHFGKGLSSLGVQTKISDGTGYYLDIRMKWKKRPTYL